MATKKIPELPVYGSKTIPLMLRDLIEISKAEGTYGSPTYGSGTSRKITIEELANNIGGIPYSGSRYEVVKETGNAIQNGVNFLVAYAAAAGKASVGDRAIVYVWAGVIDIAASLTLSPSVTIMGIGDPKDTVFDSSSGLASIFSVSDSDSDYILKNITIRNTGNPSGLSVGHGSGIIDNGKWDNVIIEAPTDTCEWNGHYSNLKCAVSGVLKGSILSDSIVENSTFIQNSCGFNSSGSVEIAGKIRKCTSTGFSFGRASGGGVEISGTIENCESESASFGNSNASGFEVLISGRISGCKASGNNNFGSSSSGGCDVNITGLIEYCESGTYSFGGNSASDTLVDVSGEILNCKIIGKKGFINSSQNSHKWLKYLGDDGEFQTEDLGINII